MWHCAMISEDDEIACLDEVRRGEVRKRWTRLSMPTTRPDISAMGCNFGDIELHSQNGPVDVDAGRRVLNGTTRDCGCTGAATGLFQNKLQLIITVGGVWAALTAVGQGESKNANILGGPETAKFWRRHRISSEKAPYAVRKRDGLPSRKSRSPKWSKDRHGRTLIPGKGKDGHQIGHQHHAHYLHSASLLFKNKIALNLIFRAIKNPFQ